MRAVTATLSIAATAFAVATLAAPAQAAPAIGSAGFGVFEPTSTLPTIAEGTTFSSSGTFNNDIFGVVTSRGDFSVDPVPDSGVLSGLTATIGDTFTFDTGFGIFSGAVTQILPDDPLVGGIFLGIRARGTFTPGGALAGFEASDASFNFDAAQTRPGGAISASFVIASPPGGGGPDVIPAPAGLALFGLALAGLGLVGRARRPA